MKLRAFLSVLVLLLLAAGGVFARSPSRSPSWSRTSPPINLTHIFEGEINKRGKPVGYHARPGG